MAISVIVSKGIRIENIVSRVESGGAEFKSRGSFTLPRGHQYILMLTQNWSSVKPVKCGFSNSDSSFMEPFDGRSTEPTQRIAFLYVDNSADMTVYVWGSTNGYSATFDFRIAIIQLT